MRMFFSGVQLMINYANVFESSFQGSLSEIFPTLKKAANMERLKKYSSQTIIHSISDVSFVSFAKSGAFNKGKPSHD